MKKLFINIFILSIIITPVISFGAFDFTKGLVPCQTSTTKDVPCDFNAFIGLIDKMINYILYMAVPICAIMFAYAGFLLITAGGSEGKTKAKGIFTNAAIGLLFVATAWLIVKTVLSILGYNDASWIGF
jgi:hypothetical protein